MRRCMKYPVKIFNTMIIIIAGTVFGIIFGGLMVGVLELIS